MDEGIEKQMAATNRKSILQIIQIKFSMSEKFTISNTKEWTNVTFFIDSDQKPQFSPFQVK